MRGLPVACVCAGLFSARAESVVVMRKIAAEEIRTDELSTGKAFRYEEGFSVNPEGEIVCDNGTGTGRRGAGWGVTLNQQRPAAVRFTGEALCETSSRFETLDFSLYLDITYQDGSHRWGVATPFDPAQEGWQRREVVFQPPKPINTLTAYALYRGMPGCARFRNLRFGSSRLDNARVFDGMTVAGARAPERGFIIRDIAGKGDFVTPPKDGREAQAKGIPQVSFTRTQAGDDAAFFDVTVTAPDARDRALTLYYTIPLPPERVRWLEPDGGAERVEGSRQSFADVAEWEIAGNGRISRYPFAAVSEGGRGLGIGIDPALPVIYRIDYNPSAGVFFLAWDLGLAREAPTVKLRFCTFRFPVEEGFRNALDAYYTLFPAAFERRVERQGIWMPFADISKVEGWEDFGFRFKEGMTETGWDDAHNILTFRYTEPMTWWMAIPKETPYTLSNAVAIAERRAAEGDRYARALQTSSFRNRRGEIVGRFKYTPWCNGIVWSLNDAPGLEGEVTGFSCKTHDRVSLQPYDPATRAGADGEYIDSANGYVTDMLDFRRDHFGRMKTPLTFSAKTGAVGIYKGMISFEYIRALADEAHRGGRLMMANSIPHSWSWLPPLLDVMGTETNWRWGDRWSPTPIRDMFYCRAMCRQKPYCYLMNTDFTKWGYADTERFMKRSLAFGFFPGFFSADASTDHYFKNPAWYNRDRPLFKKYIPLVRQVAEAGWEPLTGVAADGGGRLHVERFGRRAGNRYLTVFNAEKETVRETLRLRAVPAPCRMKELLSGRELEWPATGLPLEIAPDDIRLFALP
ncbi:MAG: hypothetical protein J6334_10430 [Kiritimatiellae bacterium]|nr:hypothetical protein [Kiritimatiellia bacterium]